MVFLDGIKGDYPAHLELALPLLRSGGLVVVDNTLLSGLVAEGRAGGGWTEDAIATMPISSAELTLVPKNTVALNEDAARKLLRLIDALEDNDDVQDVYANFDIADAVLEAVAG